VRAALKKTVFFFVVLEEKEGYVSLEPAEAARVLTRPKDRAPCVPWRMPGGRCKTLSRPVQRSLCGATWTALPSFVRMMSRYSRTPDPAAPPKSTLRRIDRRAGAAIVGSGFLFDLVHHLTPVPAQHGPPAAEPFACLGMKSAAHLPPRPFGQRPLPPNGDHMGDPIALERIGKAATTSPGYTPPFPPVFPPSPVSSTTVCPGPPPPLAVTIPRIEDFGFRKRSSVRGSCLLAVWRVRDLGTPARHDRLRPPPGKPLGGTGSLLACGFPELKSGIPFFKFPFRPDRIT